MDHRLYKNNQASTRILHGSKTDGPLFLQLLAWNQDTVSAPDENSWAANARSTGAKK
jgi:hypothetical protein